ncbi:MAG: 3-oxoacyl-[acyl-carrier-protein] synthase 3 [Phycisphaerae bacterium]|nr:3-oxoacyl-[acyl-carrier-protein] synthase 3 [Phycisphaerae bacterium]
MSQAYGMALIGSGYYLPAKRLTNADLMKLVDTTDEWITSRTGIRERRIVSDGETTVSMAVSAARDALREADLSPRDLDAIICATVTPDLILPSCSCLIQAELDASTCCAFDLAAACSGFLYGIVQADLMVRHGGYRNVLLIGSESLSRVTNYTDRSSCILFGDGAGAMVLRRTDDAVRGVKFHNLGADGKGWDFIYVPAGGTRTPATPQTIAEHQHAIQMRGRDVYKFAVTTMHRLIEEAMERCGLTLDTVKLVVPHQVNQRIIDSAVEKIGLAPERVYVNIDRFGNTSAASVPIAFHEARKRGLIEPGDAIILVGFGAGLTWGSAVLQL